MGKSVIKLCYFSALSIIAMILGMLSFACICTCSCLMHKSGYRLRWGTSAILSTSSTPARRLLHSPTRLDFSQDITLSPSYHTASLSLDLDESSISPPLPESPCTSPPSLPLMERPYTRSQGPVNQLETSL